MKKILIFSAMVFALVLFSSSIIPESSQENLDEKTIRPAAVDPYWARTYGLGNLEEARAVVQTLDGHFVVAGITHTSGNMDDLWLLKLSKNGQIKWQKKLGVANTGTEYENGLALDITADGGFIVAGSKGSQAGDTLDFWVIKFTTTGNIVWQKKFGGIKSDVAYSIHHTGDGGYLVTGYNTLPSADGQNAWVVKLLSNGNVEWQNTFGWPKEEAAYSIQQTLDKGYVFAGYTASLGFGKEDYWVVKVDIYRNIEWQLAFGGSRSDIAYSVQQTRDKGFIVAGVTNSFGGGGSDAYIIKLDFNGNTEWEYTYGGFQNDGIYSIQEVADDSYIAVGFLQRKKDGDMDLWVLKLLVRGKIEWQKLYGGSGDDIGYSVKKTNDGYIIAGSTESYASTGSEFILLRIRPNGSIDSSCSFPSSFNSFSLFPDIRPYSTPMRPESANYSASNTSLSPQSTQAQAEIICWNSIKPPLNVKLAREVKSILGFESATHTISWSANSANKSYNIKEYRVYRKLASEYAFTRIATVSGSTLSYADENLDSTVKYVYAISCVDGSGNEGPKSSTVGN